MVMNDKSSGTSVARTKRDLDKAAAALEEPGAGSRANLECRLSDLQVQFISTSARSLADVEARLVLIRDMVAAFSEILGICSTWSMRHSMTFGLCRPLSAEKGQDR